MSHRFLDFNSIDRVSDSKQYPGPGLSLFPHDGALPEEDRWSGPPGGLSGGDHGRGPGHYIKDVSDLDKGTGKSSPSGFTSRQNVIPPRSVPR